ncbi:MAG: ATP-binding protein [bacterium]
MLRFWQRLSTRLLLAVALFFLLLGLATGLLIRNRFRTVQAEASALSVQALEAEGREKLLLWAQQEAQLGNERLKQAAGLTSLAARYLLAQSEAVATEPLPPLESLSGGPQGQLYDASLQRASEVWISQSVARRAEGDSALRDRLRREMRDSAVLDDLFPMLEDYYPQVVATYYIGPSGLGRYYPRVNLIERLPPDLALTSQPFYRLAAPPANPERRIVWTKPYMDFAGLGPIVTASAPIYDDAPGIGDHFHGVISVDVTLHDLVTNLEAIRPTPGSFAFLVDGDGDLVAVPPHGVRQLLGDAAQDNGSSRLLTGDVITTTLGFPLADSGAPAVRQAMNAVRSGETGLLEVPMGAGERGAAATPASTYLLAHAPLPAVGWSLVIAAPVAEVTAPAQDVAQSIDASARGTVRSALVTLGSFFVVAVAISVVAGRRYVLQPIERLVSATRRVARGERDVTISVDRPDEFGALAHSFNQMATEVELSREELEQRVAARTRELSALYEVTAVASASLDLETVLQQSLGQVLSLLEAERGTVHLLPQEGDGLRLAAASGFLQAEATQMDEMDTGEPVEEVVRSRQPVVLQAGARQDADAILSDLAYAGVPLRAKGRVLGVLSVIRSPARSFSPEEVALLSAIGEQIGVAVDNARLYQRAEELAVVEERQRLARELHDAVTQSVYSLTLLAETGRRAAAAEQWDAVGGYLERLGHISQEALKEMRLLLYELRPATLAREGLVGALQRRLDAVEGRAGVRTRLLLPAQEVTLPALVETALYRIAQEALNNALKHARATAVTVRLRQEEGAVALEVEDNGRGFDASAGESSGLGLANMRERAEQLGGGVTIRSTPGEGTSVTARIPLPEPRGA